METEETHPMEATTGPWEATGGPKNLVARETRNASVSQILHDVNSVSGKRKNATWRNATKINDICPTAQRNANQAFRNAELPRFTKRFMLHFETLDNFWMGWVGRQRGVLRQSVSRNAVSRKARFAFQKRRFSGH